MKKSELTNHNSLILKNVTIFFISIVVSLLGFFFMGCGGKDGGNATLSIPTTATKNTISGQLFVGTTSTQTAVAAGAVSATPVVGAIVANKQQSKNIASLNIVVGQVMVQFQSSLALDTGIASLQKQFADDQLILLGSIPVVHSVTFTSKITSEYKHGTFTQAQAIEKTIDLISRVRMATEVESAVPNHINTIRVIPNDPQYQKQWNYPAIALPQAWDISTGSSSVIVAVLDTGIFSHPDITSKLVTGYDFVSDPVQAGDGDGIDADPTAIATVNHDGSHGTHVAGTIAAASNNRQGVAGVSWQSKIMPIRVLGISGGTDQDIMNGIAYAAGLANSSATLPIKAAKVINMSLGGGGYNSLFQQTIDAAWSSGVTIVAAAGNSALQGNPIEYPCAYNHVICVGAVGPDLKRAFYSEYNTSIDVVAPGGSTLLSPQNGILSTGWKQGSAAYLIEEGTSMAAPHVTGVAALMLAVDSTLTPLQIEQMLTSTALDLGVAGKDKEYGFGLINAYHAVSMAKTGSLPTTPSLFVRDTVYLSQGVTTTKASLLNMGGGSLTIQSAISQSSWLTATLSQTMAPATLTLSANGTGQSASLLSGVVDLTTSTGTSSIKVIFDNSPKIDPGIVTVGLLDLNGNVIATTTTDKSKGFTYKFSNVKSGNYFVAAKVDRNGNGSIDNWGEYLGSYPLESTPQPITMTAGGIVNAVNFQLHLLDDIVQSSGNGRPPIRGALLARVKDAQGNPIAGAKVYIDDGSINQGTTNALGKVTLFGNFNNAQTVTATAPGYTTLTYWQNNNSDLTFQLDQITTAKVPLTVTLTGLNIGDTGKLFVTGINRKDFTATASTMSFPLNVDNYLPITISAITYQAGGAADQFGFTTISSGLNTASTQVLTVALPTQWVNFTGSIVTPNGNFSQTGIISTALSLVYFGSYQPIYINGYQAITNTASFSMKMALTNASVDPVASVIAIGASNSVGESSIAMRFGSLIATSTTALPSVASLTLLDVPRLIAPAPNAAVSAGRAPTFSWSNLFTPLNETLNIISGVTKQTLWQIDFNSNINTVTLPNIPSGGLQTASSYQWNVDAVGSITFGSSSNGQNSAGFSSSQTLIFTTK